MEELKRLLQPNRDKLALTFVAFILVFLFIPLPVLERYCTDGATLQEDCPTWLARPLGTTASPSQIFDISFWISGAFVTWPAVILALMSSYLLACLMVWGYEKK